MAAACLASPVSAASAAFRNDSGDGAVYFLTSNGPAQVCLEKTPLTYRNLPVYKVSGSASFNIATWHGSGGLAYTVTAEAGALSSSNGSIY